MQEFLDKVLRFNGFDKLRSPRVPSVAEVRNFKQELLKEVDEVDSIIKRLEEYWNKSHDYTFDSPEQLLIPMEILTDLADWYGDLIVYPHSQGVRVGLPMDLVLNAIADANLTKLGEDGKPIKNEFGKIIKGPNFVAPEPRIMDIVIAAIRQALTEGAHNDQDTRGNPETVGMGLVQASGGIGKSEF